MQILLVEDNLIIGEALSDHIAASGWSVDWSVDLESAGRATRARAYALILLDLRLPDGSGLDLLRQLRAQSPLVPVIILSAYDQVSDRIEGLEIGAVDYLVKPFDLSEMIARIRRFVAPRGKCGAELRPPQTTGRLSGGLGQIPASRS